MFILLINLVKVSIFLQKVFFFGIYFSILYNKKMIIEGIET